MSLKISSLPYKERIKQALKNKTMHQAIVKAQSRMDKGKAKASEELGDWETWRQLGEDIRHLTIEHLDYYLHELSEQVAAKGGKVFFARDATEARTYIQAVIAEKNGKKVIKSKSMVSEEIGLNDTLQKKGIDVVETDLGEWILQLKQERPSHI